MPNGKPNILVLWGDDIGYWNISANNRGMMGYTTPNIDRLANEGIGFTDFYGQQSCTAGRAAFITGQNPLRTGMTKVGLPGADFGLRPEDPTIAELLKPLGYATAQFGKNHLGDLDEHLPTNHGFDEFFGNLYHLNAAEEPELEDYPKDPAFRKRFGPRGVIHSWAMPDGNQRIEDTGPLTKKRMETIDDETSARTIEYLEEAASGDKPFFVWWNATRMHLRTHVKDELRGISGQGEYNDGMVEHDRHVGAILDKLDELGLAEDTIVMYSTDNGPHYNTWPDAAITPFREEKNTNWEGAYRVPCFLRWPGKWKAGVTLNGIAALQDMLTTFLAAAGEPEIVAKCKAGHKAGDATFNVVLDGKDMNAYFAGEVATSPRDRFFYVNDDAELVALRVDDWKITFKEQRSHQMALWAEPFVDLRMPRITNLRRDPFERALEDSNSYWEWFLDHVFMLLPAQAVVAEALKEFAEFPPRQKPASFNLDRVMQKLAEAPGASS
ncbi:MAG TPA: arylsulfatase [Thermoleophilia bacterium]|nr:arylsulfatase [Thermoleophilia bacterium]